MSSFVLHVHAQGHMYLYTHVYTHIHTNTVTYEQALACSTLLGVSKLLPICFTKAVELAQSHTHLKTVWLAQSHTDLFMCDPDCFHFPMTELNGGNGDFVIHKALHICYLVI